MSQLVDIHQDVNVYSDEASMASSNGSNGTTALPILAPQTMEEPEMGLVSQQPIPPTAALFGD